VEALKIHHLHIVRGTALAAEYARRPFPVLGYEEYLDLLCDFIERLDPNIVIERMFGEAPLGLLVAPNWHRTKNDLVLDIKRKFEERDVRQGRNALRFRSQSKDAEIDEPRTARRAVRAIKRS